jgi:hypothetical protein
MRICIFFCNKNSVKVHLSHNLTGNFSGLEIKVDCMTGIQLKKILSPPEHTGRKRISFWQAILRGNNNFKNRLLF